MPEGTLRLLVYHIKGKIIENERFVKVWYFVAFKLLIFAHCWKMLLFSLVFLSSSINSSSASTKREAIVAENFNRQHLAITSFLSNFKPIRIK